jgi:hypothetical protein
MAEALLSRPPVLDTGRDEGADATRGFAFPLNVYARVLELEAGRVDYLHFAAFDGPDDDVLTAQQRASDLLWQALPPPCRLLEVGIGLGTTLARLRSEGYAAFGITPDAPQVACARARHGADLPVAISRLEDFDTGAGQWQALLFQESAQYIEPLALFEAADRLLHDGPSTLVVMDEFALRRDEPGHVGLHRLEHFCQLARRMGWRLVKRTDLSERAMPTLDYLSRHTRALQGRLIQDLGVGVAQLEALDASNRRYRDLYARGVYGYALLRFERDARPAERLVNVVPGHGPAARALFAEVFKHEMSSAHWHWKYGGGRGQAVGLLREGRLLAHYGGVSRRIAYFGQAADACQVCDVMVDPRANAGLQRQGPVFQAGASFLERQIGWGQPHLVGFGFPSQRAFGVAERQGLYAGVDEVVCASWPAADGDTPPPRWRTEALGLQGHALPERQRRVVDRLWQRMAAALADRIVCVRDAAWLQHRYLMHPTLRYDLLLLRRRWTRRAMGVLVTRVQDKQLEVLDLLADPADFPALIGQARRQARAQGLDRVQCWITRSQLALVSAIDPAAFSATPLGITVPANVHTPGPVDELRGRWFLLAGDADFT